MKLAMAIFGGLIGFLVQVFWFPTFFWGCLVVGGIVGFIIGAMLDDDGTGSGGDGGGYFDYIDLP